MTAPEDYDYPPMEDADAWRDWITYDAAPAEFLIALYAAAPKGYIEIRCIHPGERAHRQLWRTTPIATIDGERFANLIALNDEGYHLYLRMGISASKASKVADITHLTALWCDIDPRGWTPPATVDDAHALLLRKEALPIPSALVESGGGLHCYWLLQEPLVLNEQTRALASQTMRGIAKALRGDPQVCNVNNTLRLPGSYNIKYAPPRLVTLHGHIGPRYDFTTLVDAFAFYARARPRSTRRLAPLPDNVTTLPRLLQDYMQRGAAEGERNLFLYRAACAARDAGWGLGEALRVLMPRAQADGLPAREAEAAIQSAYRGQPSQPWERPHLRAISDYEDSR